MKCLAVNDDAAEFGDIDAPGALVTLRPCKMAEAAQAGEPVWVHLVGARDLFVLHEIDMVLRTRWDFESRVDVTPVVKHL